MATKLPEGEIKIAGVPITTHQIDKGRIRTLIGANTTDEHILSTSNNVVAEPVRGTKGFSATKSTTQDTNPQTSEEVDKKSFEAFLHTITYDTLHLDPQRADGLLNPRELIEAAHKIGYKGDVYTENNVAVKIDDKFAKALKEYANDKHIDVKYLEYVDLSTDFKTNPIDAIFLKAPRNGKNHTSTR
jgi:hypothetical protein